jgi:hypothetical protein
MAVTERGWLFASFGSLNRVGARPYFSRLVVTGNFGAERSSMTGEFADLAGTHSKMLSSFGSTRKSEPPKRSHQKPSRAMGRLLDEN